MEGSDVKALITGSEGPSRGAAPLVKLIPRFIRQAIAGLVENVELHD
jgi:hypothetical protein